MQITQEELLALLGASQVEIYLLKKQINTLTKAIEELQQKQE